MGRFLLISVCILLLAQISQAQSVADTSNMVKYTPDFRFNDGIFLNFESVKKNNPIPKSRIAANLEFDDQYFYDKLLEKKEFYYYDMVGTKNIIKTKNIWGYSRNGFLYINVNSEFYRITVIGSICHFVGTQTTYVNNYNDPYYNYNNYYNYYPYRYSPSTYQTTEMRQYLFDFNSGKLYPYDMQGVEILLMKDPELHDEFMSLKKKKKKQLKFLYIRKFNERNPLYFPNN